LSGLLIAKREIICFVGWVFGRIGIGFHEMRL
jgi:hypothetical protein